MQRGKLFFVLFGEGDEAKGGDAWLGQAPYFSEMMRACGEDSFFGVCREGGDACLGQPDP